MTREVAEAVREADETMGMATDMDGVLRVEEGGEMVLIEVVEAVGDIDMNTLVTFHSKSLSSSVWKAFFCWHWQDS